MWVPDSEEFVTFVGVSIKRRILLPPRKKLMGVYILRNHLNVLNIFSLHILQTTIVGVVCLVVHD